MRLIAISATMFAASLLSACQVSTGRDTAPAFASPGKASPFVEDGALTFGLSHFYFNNWAGPEIPVWVYAPRNVDPKTAPIMVMMHGAKRGAARYLSEWDQIADERGFIVIAPEFTKAAFPKSRHYNSGNMYGKEKTQTDEDKWSFSAIEPIFDRVVTELGGQQTEYVLYGHSAGSQFSHRYLFFKPDARVKRYMPANAGWYTFPDLDIEWPYGLGETAVTEETLKAALQKDVVILLGNKDDDANHESLRRTPGAAAQGPHRFARGQKFFDAAKAKAEEYDVDFGWRMRIIQDVAHSNGGIAAASGDLVVED